MEGYRGLIDGQVGIEGVGQGMPEVAQLDRELLSMGTSCLRRYRRFAPRCER
jgi:hypothetical protein